MHSTFIVNLYIAYELNTSPRNPANNFTLKNCLFGTAKLVRNTIKRKFIYNGRGIGFDGESSWSFGNEFARNAIIFAVDNSSSSHTDNWKNNILVLGEGPTQYVNDSTGAAEKKFVLTLVKQIQNFF